MFNVLKNKLFRSKRLAQFVSDMWEAWIEFDKSPTDVFEIELLETCLKYYMRIESLKAGISYGTTKHINYKYIDKIKISLGKSYVKGSINGIKSRIEKDKELLC